jgi:hypothetical protein
LRFLLASDSSVLAQVSTFRRAALQGVTQETSFASLVASAMPLPCPGRVYCARCGDAIPEGMPVYTFGGNIFHENCASIRGLDAWSAPLQVGPRFTSIIAMMPGETDAGPFAVETCSLRRGCTGYCEKCAHVSAALQVQTRSPEANQENQSVNMNCNDWDLVRQWVLIGAVVGFLLGTVSGFAAAIFVVWRWRL